MADAWQCVPAGWSQELSCHWLLTSDCFSLTKYLGFLEDRSSLLVILSILLEA